MSTAIICFRTSQTKSLASCCDRRKSCTATYPAPAPQPVLMPPFGSKSVLFVCSSSFDQISLVSRKSRAVLWKYPICDFGNTIPSLLNTSSKPAHRAVNRTYVSSHFSRRIMPAVSTSAQSSSSVCIAGRNGRSICLLITIFSSNDDCFEILALPQSEATSTPSRIAKKKIPR